jgi:hypothetical protein
MPEFSQRDQASTDIWTYASQQFARRASGNAWVIRGAQTRANNVWDTEEFPALQQNPNIRCIFQINATTTILFLIQSCCGRCREAVDTTIAFKNEQYVAFVFLFSKLNRHSSAIHESSGM